MGSSYKKLLAGIKLGVRIYVSNFLSDYFWQKIAAESEEEKQVHTRTINVLSYFQISNY
jgi:hypothetical protein